MNHIHTLLLSHVSFTIPVASALGTKEHSRAFISKLVSICKTIPVSARELLDFCFAFASYLPFYSIDPPGMQKQKSFFT